MTHRKDGRWVKRITINGKKISFYSSAKTEKAAERDVQRQLLEFAQKEEKGKTFKEVAEEWEEIETAKIQETTWVKHHKSKYNVICKHFSDRYIKDITLDDISAFLKSKYSYSKKTVTAYKSVLNMIFDYALIKGYVSSNNIHAINIPDTLSSKVRENASDEDIEIVNNNYTGDGLLFYMALWTGLRPSELIALTDKDIDREAKMIYVNKVIVHNSNQPVLRNAPKTKAGQRVVPITDNLLKVLPKFKGLLFCDSKGNPLTKKAMDCMKARYKKQTGITSTLYQFRHSYATMLVELKLDEKVIEKIMGHTSIKTTLGIYAQARQKKLNEAQKQISKFNF